MKAACSAAAPALLAHGIGYRYGSQVTLNDVQLAIHPREVVGVVGPNGAGKTTLLRVLAGLLAPATGNVSWFGSASITRVLRRRIGYLPDQAALFDELTGLENLLLFASIRKASAAAAPCRAVGTALGLTEAQLVARAATYSFGMRRKLAIAQTLVGEPELLLFDEPTLGLDAGARDLLGAELRARATGAAVLLASNDLPFIQAHCDRVVFLAGGRVLLEGKPAELLEPIRAQVGFQVTLGETYRPVRLPDLQETAVDALSVTFRSNRGAELLPALIEALLRAGNEIESIGVRRADLSDVFRRLTGAEWQSQGPTE